MQHSAYFRAELSCLQLTSCMNNILTSSNWEKNLFKMCFSVLCLQPNFGMKSDHVQLKSNTAFNRMAFVAFVQETI